MKHSGDRPMKRPTGPYEKWSARQLASHSRRQDITIRKLTSRLKQGSDSGREYAELVEELARTQEHARYERSELRAAREDAASEGLGTDEIAGKPALAKYFATWGKFVTGFRNLPFIRRTEGIDGLDIAQERLLRYLTILHVVPARGGFESGEQDRIERYIQNDALFHMFCWDTRWSRNATKKFLKQARHAFMRPSIWAIYEKSSEMGAIDRLGTVVK